MATFCYDARIQHVVVHVDGPLESQARLMGKDKLRKRGVGKDYEEDEDILKDRQLFLKCLWVVLNG